MSIMCCERVEWSGCMTYCSLTCDFYSAIRNYNVLDEALKQWRHWQADYWKTPISFRLQKDKLKTSVSFWLQKDKLKSSINYMILTNSYNCGNGTLQLTQCHSTTIQVTIPPQQLEDTPTHKLWSHYISVLLSTNQFFTS